MVVAERCVRVYGKLQAVGVKFGVLKRDVNLTQVFADPVEVTNEARGRLVEAILGDLRDLTAAQEMSGRMCVTHARRARKDAKPEKLAEAGRAEVSLEYSRW
jgi:hypothetical protein